jgi:hypothetical protein
MLQALRSRVLAFATLAAFLVAQPAVGCAALCLFQRHHADAHALPGGHTGSSAVNGSACHTGDTGAVQRSPVQVLSPMSPARAPVLGMAPTRWVQPARTLPTPPQPLSHTVEPPPPRFV